MSCGTVTAFDKNGKELVSRHYSSVEKRKEIISFFVYDYPDNFGYYEIAPDIISDMTDGKGMNMRYFEPYKKRFYRKNEPLVFPLDHGIRSKPPRKNKYAKYQKIHHLPK